MQRKVLNSLSWPVWFSLINNNHLRFRLPILHCKASIYPDSPVTSEQFSQCHLRYYLKNSHPVKCSSQLLGCEYFLSLQGWRIVPHFNYDDVCICQISNQVLLNVNSISTNMSFIKLKKGVSNQKWLVKWQTVEKAMKFVFLGILCWDCGCKTFVYIVLITPCSSVGKESACKAEDWVWFLGWEDTLEKEMATHSRILAWRIPGQRSLAGYRLWGRKSRTWLSD